MPDSTRHALTVSALLAASVLGPLPAQALPRPIAEVLIDATEIDRLIVEGLREQGMKPNPRADAATFLRRSHLSIIGRIPSLKQTRRFLKSRKSHKRRELIEELIRSPGYTSSMFNYLADLLRVKTRLASQTSGEPYVQWIKQAISEDLPYDRLVYQMLTAEGAAHARGNGATGYYLRDRGMPEASMANTLRVFLGTRLECAQCHDHPFDKWTQRQFYEMAAFAGGMRYQQRLRDSDEGQRLLKMRDQIRADGDRLALQGFGRILRRASSGISGSGNGLIRLPKDFKGDDGRPGQWVKAKTIFGEAVDLPVKLPREQTRRRRGRTRARAARAGGPEIGSRAAFADWLIAPDNPRFTKVIANRMWKRVMGLGLIEPLDDIDDNTMASNPALLASLEGLMRRLDYDLREFQRVLFHTELFGRRASADEALGDVPFFYRGPLLRRMSAEQLWDSMLTLVVVDPDVGLDAPRQREVDRVHDRYQELANLSDAELAERVDMEVMRQTEPEKYRALIATRRNQARKQRAEQNAIYRKLARARRARDQAEVARILARLAADGIPDPSTQPRYNRRLVRASELPSPAPIGHFLRQFGQSDRERIEGADADANVPQVLNLLNGYVEESILGNERALLMRSLKVVHKKDGKIRLAYVSILNRSPSMAELRMWHEDFAQDPEQATKDLVWTLLNSNEFRFVQ